MACALGGSGGRAPYVPFRVGAACRRRTGVRVAERALVALVRRPGCPSFTMRSPAPVRACCRRAQPLGSAVSFVSTLGASPSRREAVLPARDAVGERLCGHLAWRWKQGPTRSLSDESTASGDVAGR